MTAILRILKGPNVLHEVALRGVERIGGVMFYELDLADIPRVPEPDALTKNDRQNVRQRYSDLPTQENLNPLPGQSDFLHEDTP